MNIPWRTFGGLDCRERLPCWCCLDSAAVSSGPSITPMARRSSPLLSLVAFSGSSLVDLSGFTFFRRLG